MDLTNRVLIIGGALLWIFLVLVVILLAWGAPDESIERLGDLASYLEDHNTTAAKLIVTFGGLILALLGVIVIIAEVAPPETGSLKVQKVGAGEARIGTDEIALRLESELRLLPQITEVQARVQGRGEKAEVALDLHVGAEADLSATAEEACRRARQLVEEQMGVALSRPPQAQLRYRELRVARPAPSAGTPSATPPAPSASPREEPATSSAGWGPLPGASAPPGPPAASPTSPPFSTEASHEPSERPQEDRPAGA